MFPKLNMTGDTKAMRNGIIAAKLLLRYTITKKTIKTSTRLELCSFRGGRETKQAQPKTRREE